MTNTLNLPPELYEATDHLIQSLLASEPFLVYQQSQVQLESDPQARALLARLSALQAHLRRQQTNGGVTQAEIEELRALQAQVQANGAIQAYAQSQQAAMALLRAVNQEVSQLLGIDFAMLARQTTC
jgi:cell fate (sporulation/competence/biofilm development) regulator YlbF (YheA/YmcA/DUF963 family)